MIVDRLGNPMFKGTLVVYCTRGSAYLTLGRLTGETKTGDKSLHPYKPGELIAVRSIDEKTFKENGRKTWRSPDEFLVYFYDR